MSDALTRFETIGQLYYERYHCLRPGKSESLESYRDSSSDENRTQFDQWFATQAFTDAVDKIARLEASVKQLTNEILYLNEEAAGDNI